MGTPDRRLRLARSKSVAPFAAVLGLSLALLTALPVSGAVAVAASGANPPSTYWAFGAQRSVNASGYAADGNTTFTIHAAFGWNTVLRQVNGTAGHFEIIGNRTVGASLFVTYCRPECPNSLRTLNISERLWETESSYANFTDGGTVYTGGQPTAALALLDSSVSAKGNLTEAASAKITGALGHTYSASQGLSIAASARASVRFQPALGLLPLNLNLGGWNSSAQYAASGNWSIVVGAHSTSFFGAHSSSSQSYPGGFSGVSGTAALSATSEGYLTLKDGDSADQVGTSITGPFVAWDGFILVPSAAELLDQSAPPWAGEQSGAQDASTARLDVGASLHPGHLPVLASMASYLPGATDSGSPSLESGVTTALAGSPGSGGTSGGPLDGPPPTTIQGQPESPSAANASSLCLITGCNAPGASSFGRAWVLGGVVGIVAAVAAAAVIVKRQPPRKAPPSPNSALYPPLNASTTRPKTPAVPPVESPGGDPLGHLW